MAQDYSPSLVTKNLVFCGDAAMKSAAGPATLLYDKVNNNNGTMYNGTCCTFDGTNDYIDCGTALGTDFGDNYTGGFTVSLWFKLDSADKGLFNISSFSSSYGAMSFYVSGYELIFRLASDVSTKVPMSDTASWHHVVGTYDGSTIKKIYLDGALGDSDSYTADLDLDGLKTIIGGFYSNAYCVDGQIADVKVFDVELSLLQVKELYNDSKVIIPSNVSQTNLKGWWPLTEGAGDIVYDGSGNGNSGTFENDTVSNSAQTGCPQLVQGYNRPMLFDGSSDYVSIADSATLSVGSTFTISYWFYPEDITTESYHVSKNTYTGNQKSYAVNQYSTGKTQFRVSGDGSSHIECTGDTVMSNKAWHHIVHVFDGGAGTKLKGWVDGTAQTFNQQPNVTSAYDSTSILCLGTRDAGLTAPFAGIINEVIIYNSALDATDAAALYATGPNGGPLPPDPRTMSYSSSTTSANIMGYWRNDNNVTLTDLSGNSNTGTAIGSPPTLLFKQGINGQKNVNTGRDNQGFPLLYQNNGAIGFVSNSVDLGNVVSFDNTDNFTVEAWFKAALDGSGNGFSYQPIISKEGSAEFGYAIKLDYNVAGGPWLYGLVNGTTNRYQYSSALNAGQWYHACVTFSSSANYITVFIDGAQNHGPYSVQGAFSGTTNTNSLKLGNGSYYTADFSGQIGSSKIYNRLLSQAEIKQNYNAQKSRFE